jgi:hypothetical protein
LTILVIGLFKYMYKILTNYGVQKWFSVVVLNRNREMNIKKVGNTSDVLKHTAILFFKITLSDFLMYRSKLLRFNDNSS